MKRSVWRWNWLVSPPPTTTSAGAMVAGARNWGLYLAAKRSKPFHRQLTRLALAMAEREYGRERGSSRTPGAAAAAGSPVAVTEDTDPFGPGSMFGGSDPARVADPFAEPEEPAVGGETEY